MDSKKRTSVRVSVSVDINGKKIKKIKKKTFDKSLVKKKKTKPKSREVNQRFKTVKSLDKPSKQTIPQYMPHNGSNGFATSTPDETREIFVKKPSIEFIPSQPIIEYRDKIVHVKGDTQYITKLVKVPEIRYMKPKPVDVQSVETQSEPVEPEIEYRDSEPIIKFKTRYIDKIEYRGRVPVESKDQASDPKPLDYRIDDPMTSEDMHYISKKYLRSAEKKAIALANPRKKKPQEEPLAPPPLRTPDRMASQKRNTYEPNVKTEPNESEDEVKETYVNDGFPIYLFNDFNYDPDL